jgi:hypothetical protein
MFLRISYDEGCTAWDFSSSEILSCMCAGTSTRMLGRTIRFHINDGEMPN